MIKGVGIDIIDIKRIKSIMEKFGEKFYEKILTEKEIAYCKSYKAKPEPHFAGKVCIERSIFKSTRNRYI